MALSDTNNKPAANRNLMFGMRSTGKLHLGHYEGVLKNMYALQDKYNCFIEVADWHSITTNTDTANIRENIIEMVIDWLASGIDPEKATIFVQSYVPEHAELYVLLSMLTPVSWLERVPTYKEQIQQLNLSDNTSFGFLGYPVLQAVDIALYKAAHVPIGRDQVPHLEFTREILRRFNGTFGELLVEPQPVFTENQVMLGLDNRKMSKSYGNAVYLCETEDETTQKIVRMITDPNRIKKTDPGNPEVCNVYSYHKIYSGAETCERVKNECPQAKIGCVECKKILASKINDKYRELRSKRSYYSENRKMIEEILVEGSKKARITAGQTLLEVKEKMRFKFF